MWYVGRAADQAYEHVSTEDGQLSLFGVEVLPIFIVACMRVCKRMSQLRFFQLRALCDLPSSHCRLLTLRDAVGSALGAQGLSWLQRRSYRGHLEIHRRQNSELESNQRKHVFDRHVRLAACFAADPLLCHHALLYSTHLACARWCHVYVSA
jgi:hypothetical protein